MSSMMTDEARYTGGVLDDPLIPEKDLLAELPGVSERTWADWRRAGRTPAAITKGKHRWYRRSVVAEWLLADEKPSAATRAGVAA